MDNKDWVKELAVGDEAIYAHGYSSKSYSIAQVVKVTKTQVTIRTNMHFGTGLRRAKFNRKTGKPVGGNQYSSEGIVQATEESKSTALHHQLRAWLSILDARQLNLQQLQTMHAAYERHKETT